MRIIAVINQKGGCGKTTTTVNLGACLAFLKKKVLIVDLDPQAHATLGLGINPGDYERSISDLLLEKAGPGIDQIILELSETLHLLPADVLLSTAEPVLMQRDNREYTLANILTPLNGRYDFVLIDCPPHIGTLTFNALFACDEAIIPMESGLFALHGLAKLLETVAIVKEQRPIAVHALATMFDRRTRIAQESLDELQRHLPDQVLKTVIHNNVKLKEAASYGRTIIDYDKTSSGFADYMSLAREIMAPRKAARKTPDVRALKPVVTKDGVLFRYYSPQATHVCVVADFNNWQVGEAPLQKLDENGVWQRVVPLEKGTYQYKFYVDDTWVNDPHNPRREEGAYGENSVIEID